MFSFLRDVFKVAGRGSRSVSPAFFPTAVLSGALCLTMILLTVLGWQAWSVYRSRNRTESHTFLIQQLSDRIVYFDEVLTMSANMAAATGEPQWQKRYREAEPQLDSTIKQSTHLFLGIISL